MCLHSFLIFQYTSHFRLDTFNPTLLRTPEGELLIENGQWHLFYSTKKNAIEHAVSTNDDDHWKLRYMSRINQKWKSHAIALATKRGKLVE